MSVEFDDVFEREQPLASPRPSFIIDPETPEAIAAQLRLDEQWLLQRPALRTLALAHVTASDETPQPAVWDRLTSLKTCRYFEFDEQTETTISRDDTIRALMVQRSQRTSPANAAELAFRVRKRRLEIFMERAVLAKTAGQAALNGSE